MSETHSTVGAGMSFCLSKVEVILNCKGFTCSSHMLPHTHTRARAITQFNGILLSHKVYVFLSWDALMPLNLIFIQSMRTLICVTASSAQFNTVF